MAKCDCYHQHGLKFLCYGTKEMEECSCGGDTRKCNFYPEKRKQKMATEKRLIDLEVAIKTVLAVLGGKVTSFVAMDVVEALECATVKYGQWEIIAIAVVDAVCKCSNCGEEAIMRKRNKPYPICPNCGANMDGGNANGKE